MLRILTFCFAVACTTLPSLVGHLEPREERLVLVDDTFPELIDPVMIDYLPGTGFVLTDRSDRDLKIYDSAGRRVGTIGGAGSGAGAFSILTSGFGLDGAIYAVDARLRITKFSPSGRVIRVWEPSPDVFGRPWKARGVDSLLLLIRHPLDPPLTGYLDLVTPDGTLVHRLFDMSKKVGSDQQSRGATNVVADGRDGCVFAALATISMITAYNSGGDVLGQVRLPTGRPSDEHYITSIVALNGCSALVQINRFPSSGRANRKTDGGVIYEVRATQHGLEISDTAVPTTGLLLGRGSNDSGMVLLPREQTQGATVLLSIFHANFSQTRDGGA